MAFLDPASRTNTVGGVFEIANLGNSTVPTLAITDGTTPIVSVESNPSGTNLVVDGTLECDVLTLDGMVVLGNGLEDRVSFNGHIRAPGEYSAPV